MSTLYHIIGQMLADGSKEENDSRKDPSPPGDDIIKLVLRESRENGCPSLDSAAAHDMPDQD